MFRRSAIPLALAALLAAPAAASASDVEITAGDTVLVEAAAGEDNDIDIGQSFPNLTIEDAEGITAGPGCAQVNVNRATCPLVNFDDIAVFVDDGENEVTALPGKPIYINGFTADENRFQTYGSAPAELAGGAGPDLLRTGFGNDDVDGHGGNDEIVTGSGDDDLSGGAGQDTMDPGSGDDEIDGGDDRDLADYSSRNAPLDLSIDGVDNDGAAGELDDIHTDVERVHGGSAADSITGSPARDSLHGGAGPDVIRGNGGDDDIEGNDGGDDIGGGSGVDYVNGGPGDDTIDGGFSGDVLYGGDGNDAIAGAHGGDEIAGNDGNDDLTGGIDDDELLGSGGDDVLQGGQGRDELNGNDGVDTADYSGHSSPVTVDLDGAGPDDGAASEGDTVHADVENVTGGSGPDRITGNGGVNRLDGGAGNDALDGRAGADAIVCGPGLDTFVPDPADSLSGCEPAAGKPAGPGGTPLPQGNAKGSRPKLVIGPRTVRVTRKRVARLTVRCPAAAKAACTGTLRLQRKVKGKVRRLGSKRFTVRAGAKRTLRIKLRRKDAKRVARRPLKVTAVARARNAESGAASAKRKVTLKRRAAR